MMMGKGMGVDPSAMPAMPAMPEPVPNMGLPNMGQSFLMKGKAMMAKGMMMDMLGKAAMKGKGGLWEDPSWWNPGSATPSPSGSEWSWMEGVSDNSWGMNDLIKSWS